MNPFINIPYHPDFSGMTPDLAEEALAKLLPEARAKIAGLEEKHIPTWDGLMRPLYDATHPLSLAWSLLSHLLSVMNTDAWRKVQQKWQPEIVAFSLRVGQSPLFYNSFCTLQERDTLSRTLTPVQRRILEKIILDARLAGVGLPPDKQKRFNALQAEIAQLGTTFRNNVLDATKAFSLILTKPEETVGLPSDLLASTVFKTDEGQVAWKITLEAPVYLPFMMHSRNREARERLYRAFVTRASAGQTDNSALIERILALRQELATLLDFATYADMSLSTKSARSVAAVDVLLEKLFVAAHPQGVREMADLQAFADALPERQAKKDTSPLQPWDVSFFAERLREHRYDYSDEELSKYFTYPKVLEGLFSLAQRLFGIRIQDATGEVPTWHSDVKFYKVFDASDTCIAGIYSDPYSRPETKSSGAWANDFRTRRRMPDGSIERPLAVMVCNQSKPVGAQPSLMRFSEVRTLFHEFGHVLQHVLTTVDEPEASGLNNIEWDAVEIASQFMENWCHDQKTLQSITAHIDTGASLPLDLYQRLRSAQYFRAATTIMRQVAFAATDMNLYARYPQPCWPNAHAVCRACTEKYATTPSLAEDKFLCSFSHIFSGGYAAGYYSYKWSEVMSADAFGAFEEAGIENEKAIKEAGIRFRDTFLARGGGADPMDVFRAFRGRAPTIDALLRHAGLKQ